jgi:hypothetical protein
MNFRLRFSATFRNSKIRKFSNFARLAQLAEQVTFNQHDPDIKGSLLPNRLSIFWDPLKSNSSRPPRPKRGQRKLRCCSAGKLDSPSAKCRHRTNVVLFMVTDFQRKAYTFEVDDVGAEGGAEKWCAVEGLTPSGNRREPDRSGAYVCQNLC